MDKKPYNAPEALVVEIKTQRVICVSVMMYYFVLDGSSAEVDFSREGYGEASIADWN